jgi:hypothetical protein
VRTFVRRAAAVLVASQSFLLVFYALVGWDLAAGIGPDVGPPPPDSDRFAAAAPFLFLLPWFAVGTVALWNCSPLPTPWRLVERAVLCVVVAGNVFYVYFVIFVSDYSVQDAVGVVINAVTAAGALAVAGICALVIAGRLRNEPSDY